MTTCMWPARKELVEQLEELRTERFEQIDRDHPGEREAFYAQRIESIRASQEK